MYTPPTGAFVNFEFAGAYYAPNGALLHFDLGVDNPPIVSYFDATTDDAVGSITANAIIPIIGNINAITDDSGGTFSANNPPIYRGSISATTDNAIGSVDAVIVKSIRHITQSFEFITIKSKEATLITTVTNTKSIKKSLALKSTLNESHNLNNAINVAAQKCDALQLETSVIAQNTRDATHAFNTNSFKEPPSEYRYTPTAIFNTGITLNKRDFSVTTNEYKSAIPVNFNLIETIPTGFDFDLNESFTLPVTITRAIFDTVSTYQPGTLFFTAWANDNVFFSHSIERAGMRVVANVIAQESNDIEARFITNCIDSAAIIKRCNFDLKNATEIKETINIINTESNWLQKQFEQNNQCSNSIVYRIADLITDSRAIWNTPPTKYGAIIDPPRPPIYTPPNHVTVTIPTKQVYHMQHSISVTLEDLTPISASSISLSLDNDSFAWSFSCVLLDKLQIDLVKPPLNDYPVILIVTINGIEFKVMIETVTHQRVFALDTVSLSGRSLSALLSSPYEVQRSATQSSAMTVQQLAQLELLSDWTIDWKATNWLVPAPVLFSYMRKSPIQVISEIADNIGATTIPSRNSKSIKIQPRYTVLPWNFYSTEPDLIIPDSAITAVTYRNSRPTQANVIYIHGNSEGGVLSRCRLNGTAGDRPLTTMNNSLMSSVAATRALAETMLANNYQQPAIQSISMKLGGEFPLVSIGDFIQINIDGGQVRGVVNSVSIDAGMDSVNQTIQIGAKSTSVWSAFKEIMPAPPLLVGSISSVNGENCLLTLIDGSVISVRGKGTVGDAYFARNGLLENKAPGLLLNEVVI